ncbi:UNVERIFIED_CONTAM: protein MOR1 [Sesamum latifolium]|uniref:Protein MOR1 n=1 Tax=Sesamum latifolium TaxID=2727402 RepID=A0AAW2TSS4_9LAMI
MSTIGALASVVGQPGDKSSKDKSADVSKAAEPCFIDIFNVTKNLKDVQGSALAIVVEQLKLYGAFQESFESGRSISAGIKSKTSSKVTKNLKDVQGSALAIVVEQLKSLWGFSRVLFVPRDQDKVDRVSSRHQHSVTRFAQCEVLKQGMITLAVDIQQVNYFGALVYGQRSLIT